MARTVDPRAVPLGRKIRRRRLAAKLTGRDVQKRAGIHPTSLSLIEQGKQWPSIPQLDALTRLLGPLRGSEARGRNGVTAGAA